MAASPHRAWLLAAALLLLPHSAGAEEEAAPLDTQLSINDGLVVADFDVSSAFTEIFRKRLNSGLRSNMLIDVRILDAEGEVIGGGFRQCNFRFEVWEELLKVEILEQGRRFSRRTQVIDRGLRECGEVHGLAIADTTVLLASGGYIVEATVRFNALDKESLQKAREFLSNPRGKRPTGPPSFFGKLAELFSPKPELGGEVFLFRSRPLARPRRP